MLSESDDYQLSAEKFYDALLESNHLQIECFLRNKLVDPNSVDFEEPPTRKLEVPIRPLYAAETPLTCAYIKGDFKTVALLLKYGADVNATKPEDNMSALIDLCFSDTREDVNCLKLLKQYNNVDINSNNDDQHNELFYAIINRKFVTIATLMAYNSSIEYESDIVKSFFQRKFSPMVLQYFAIYFWRINIVNELSKISAYAIFVPYFQEMERMSNTYFSPKNSTTVLKFLQSTVKRAGILLAADDIYSRLKDIKYLDETWPLFSKHLQNCFNDGIQYLLTESKFTKIFSKHMPSERCLPNEVALKVSYFLNIEDMEKFNKIFNIKLDAEETT